MNKVLIIDDKSLIRKLLAGMPELEGYEVYQEGKRKRKQRNC